MQSNLKWTLMSSATHTTTLHTDEWLFFSPLPKALTHDQPSLFCLNSEFSRIWCIKKYLIFTIKKIWHLVRCIQRTRLKHKTGKQYACMSSSLLVRWLCVGVKQRLLSILATEMHIWSGHGREKAFPSKHSNRGTSAKGDRWDSGL